METQVLALSIFVGVFALATIRKIPVGIMMLAVAGGTGIWLAGMKVSDVLTGFPIGLFVLLIGVTYFFGIAQSNGTIGQLISSAVSRAGNRAFLMPLVFFALTAGISAMGSPPASLVMAPIGMPLAKRYGIDPALMGIAMGCGLSAGGFAPTSLFGIVTYGTAHSVGIPLEPMLLFLWAIAANLALLVAAYLMFGGIQLFKERGILAGSHVGEGVPRGETTRPAPLVPGIGGTDSRTVLLERGEVTGTSLNSIQRITVLCIILLFATIIVLSALGLNPDIGILCLAFATILAAVDPAGGKAAVGKIDWSTGLMVGGIITFVGVLQKLGAVQLLGEGASHIGSPLVAALVICAVGGLVSAFASTTGMLAALVPLAIPLISHGNIEGWAVIVALGICSSIVDVSPFSTTGATVIACTEEPDRPRMVRILTRWGLSMVVIGPILLTGLIIIPTTW